MNKINYADIYNKSYSKYTPEWLSVENMDSINREISLEHSTLAKFVELVISHFELDYKLPNFDVIELGSGLAALSLDLASKVKSMHAVDISPIAIAMASQLARMKNQQIQFTCADVTTSKGLEIEHRFDLLIDSHLLHCLCTKSERRNYFSSLKSLMKEDSRVLIETMTFQRSMQFPIGYEFTQENILLKSINDVYVPIRAIYDSREIESEVKENGLKIDYLYYHNELSFDVFDDYRDYPVEYLPKVLRMCLSLAK